MDEAYQKFCNATISAAKKSIPRGRRAKHTPCWNDECKKLFQTSHQPGQMPNKLYQLTALISKMDQNKKERWTEAVKFIDFKHSILKAWSILNNFIGRKTPTHHHCPVPADSIATQLTRNGMYKTPDCAFSKQVQREISHLRKTDIPGYTPISGSFFQEEFHTALQHLKDGKAASPEAICPELITHADMEIKSHGYVNFYLPA